MAPVCHIISLHVWRLSRPAQPGKDWPIYGDSYNNQRYSSLREITAVNAIKLQAKWTYHVEGMHGLESVPVVANGVVYISGYNRIDALDARTGNVIWRFRREPATGAFQRGAAVAQNRVYITTNDGHVLALDARTGAQIWESNGGPQVSFAGTPPLVANGKILVSQTLVYYSSFNTQSLRIVTPAYQLARRVGGIVM